MSNEEWKSAAELGFSKYLYSNLGRIKNISSGKIAEGSIINGCRVYYLTNNDDKRKQIRAHVLISNFYEIISEKNNYIWVPIPGFERYKICEEGKFLSTRGEIKNTVIYCNSVNVELIKDNKRFTIRARMLVATVFVPNPNNFKYVKLKDKNFMNIHKNNLEWANNTSQDEDSPDEIWEPLIGFPKYEINYKGIRNIITHKMLTPYISSNGYPMLNLCIDNDHKRAIYLHIAIATQYILNPNPEHLIEVNHKNGKKDDFRIEKS
jgi:hypothetical protein